jgi:glycerol-3-phosphate dehydrogenase
VRARARNLQRKGARVARLQHEQARTAEDLLFRRTRAGLLNAAATASCMTQLERALAD